MIRQRMARQQRNSGPRATVTPLPLPLQGLFVDARTAELSGVYAAELHNLRTDGVAVELRKQYLLGAADQLALQRLPFAFGASPRYIDLRATQAECNGAMFARQFDGNAMAAYLSSQVIIADGFDLPVVYTGSAFVAALFTTTTGVSPSAFDGVIAHHDRPFFWKTNGNLEFYYGDIGAVTGPLVRFPLDRLGNITGNILAMVSVTLDAGENSNDALAIYTSTGQIVVYEGLNPSDANDWGLSTRIQVAPPLSRFGITRVGGDVWVMTAQGVVSIRDTIQNGVLALVNPAARAISDDILKLAQNTEAEWQLHIAADGSQIIINYFTHDVQKQFIWQTDSKAWSTADYPARRWHNLVLATQFTTEIGRIGTVALADNPEEAITAVWHTGWFHAGGERTVAAIIPTIIARGPLTLKISVLRDHNESAADIAEAEQTVTVDPENTAPALQTVALKEAIPCGITGTEFQIRMELTASWAQIVQMRVVLV